LKRFFLEKKKFGRLGEKNWKVQNVAIYSKNRRCKK
jgi:hypothetical protein